MHEVVPEYAKSIIFLMKKI